MASSDSLSGPPIKIAVLRPGRLGDLLLAVPGLRALRHSFPRAEITLIAQPWARDLVRRTGYVDRFLEFPGFPGMPEAPFRRERTLDFLQQSAVYGYDLVLDLHGCEPPAAILAALLGGKRVAGYCLHPEVARHLDVCLPWRDGEHEVHRVLRLVQAVGGSPCGTYLEFPLVEDDFREVEGLPGVQEALASGDPVVAVHPGAGDPGKRWPADRFAGLADALARDTGCRVVLLGGPLELDLVEQVSGRMEARPISLAGRLSLGGLAALISQVDLYVGNDTGPSHLAVAVGTPSIAIFGPTDTGRWAPLDADIHRAVHQPILNQVSVEAVLAVARDLLERSWRDRAGTGGSPRSSLAWVSRMLRASHRTSSTPTL